jgi:polar amino acid transport system substrate-binding protein
MHKLFLSLFTSLLVASAAQTQTIAFTTEEYPPFTYRENGEISGAMVDQVRQIMAGLGPYTIEMMPWARAYAQAKTTPMSCVFATAHTPERDQAFKWVQPLVIGHSYLIKHKGSPVVATTLEEAKQYSVGTWREDYTETLLHKLEFPKIDVANNMPATLKKLMNDRIELMPISALYYDRLIKEGQPVERVLTLSEQTTGIACQKDFPEDLRQKMQAALDGLIADGTQKKIFLQYGMQLDN